MKSSKNVVTVATILMAMSNGELDAGLDQIVAGVRDRRDILSHAKLATLRVGQKVKLNYKVRPAYMAGMTGTVERVNGKSVMMKFDKAHYRFGASARVVVGLVEAI